MEVIEIKQAEVLQAINKSAIDIQVATARQYPRNIPDVLNKISTYATMDTETASDCFYVLRRSGSGGSTTVEGLSVRMAEIIAGAWGNLRVQTRIVGNDGRTITAQGICHDLETNVAVSVEVKRRITDKYGKTYSEDMQVVTGNAASAIAFRNAVLKVVPKAVTKRVIEGVKQVALGQSLDLETSRQKMLEYFGKLGVTKDMILDYLNLKKVEEIDKEAVFELRATANAIKEGTTTVQETFIKAANEKRQTENARKNVESAMAKIEEAKTRQNKASEAKDVKNTEETDKEPQKG